MEVKDGQIQEIFQNIPEDAGNEYKILMYYRADFLMMTFFTLLSQVSNLAVVGIIYTNIPQLAAGLYGKFYCYTDICYFQKDG